MIFDIYIYIALQKELDYFASHMNACPYQRCSSFLLNRRIHARNHDLLVCAVECMQIHTLSCTFRSGIVWWVRSKTRIASKFISHAIITGLFPCCKNLEGGLIMQFMHTPSIRLIFGLCDSKYTTAGVLLVATANDSGDFPY